MKVPSLRDLVDADLPLSESELGDIWREVQRRRESSLSFKEGTILFISYFGPAILLLLVGAFIVDRTGARLFGMTILAILMCAWFCAAIVMLTRRDWYAIPFRRELNRRGFEVCAFCGYWLRGLNTDTTRCPECGKPLSLWGEKK